jgi:MFS superfamily sulfate permease-like transporter
MELIAVIIGVVLMILIVVPKRPPDAPPAFIITQHQPEELPSPVPGFLILVVLVVLICVVYAFG